MTPGGVVADPDALPPLETTAQDATDGGADGAPVSMADDRSVFRVQLDNFDGPFDLLLQLISQHRMDVTEVALHRVTDDFIAYTKAMGDDWDLEQVTAFLVVAATLLDLKAARLLPDADPENPEELAYLEAKDLLFARLLAYRAYQQVAGLFRELEAGALRRYPRAVTLRTAISGCCPRSGSGWMPTRSPSWPPRCSGRNRRRACRWITSTRPPSRWPNTPPRSASCCPAAAR